MLRLRYNAVDMQPQTSKLMDVEDLADRWKLPEARIRHYVREGSLPVVRLGTKAGRIMFGRKAIEALEAGELIAVE